MPKIFLAEIFSAKIFLALYGKNIFSKKIFFKKISDLGIRRFGGYHEAELVESFRMSYKSSQTEQTSPHYDQIWHLHLHLHLGGHNGRPRWEATGRQNFPESRLPAYFPC